MKRIRRFVLFARTLLTSAWNEFRITGQIKWRTLPKIAAALWPREQPDRRPGSCWWLRMKGCGRCPIYDRARRACGRLGETFERDGKVLPIGCSCYMPIKAGVEESLCFLWIETGGEHGEDWAKMLDKAKAQAQSAKK